MLDDRTCPLLHHHQLLQQQQQAGPSQTATVDIIAGTIPGQCSVCIIGNDSIQLVVVCTSLFTADFICLLFSA